MLFFYFNTAIPQIRPTPKQSLSVLFFTGAIPGGLSIGPPGKSSIDDSYGRYDLIQNNESPASPPVAVPHSWSRAKTDSDKISNGSSINWPPGNKMQSIRVKLMSLNHTVWFYLLHPSDMKNETLGNYDFICPCLFIFLYLEQNFIQECHGKDCRILILKMTLMLLLEVFQLGLP